MSKKLFIIPYLWFLYGTEVHSRTCYFSVVFFLHLVCLSTYVWWNCEWIFICDRLQYVKKKNQCWKTIVFLHIHIRRGLPPCPWTSNNGDVKCDFPHRQVMGALSCHGLSRRAWRVANSTCAHYCTVILLPPHHPQRAWASSEKGIPSEWNELLTQWF